MKRDQTLQLLAKHGDDLRKLGVRSLSLFGSVARDEATQQSDVDVLVELDTPSGMFQLVRIQHYLESLLHCRVDIGTPNSLKPSVRQRVLAEAVHVA